MIKYIQELKVLEETDVELTRQLHVLQAHLLQYESLLNGFHTSVCFLEKTPNPVMESDNFTHDQRMCSKGIMGKQCENLLSEIDPVKRRRTMLINRSKIALDLAFVNANIEDSRPTRMLTELTVRDLAAMRLVPLCPPGSNLFAAGDTTNKLLFPRSRF